MILTAALLPTILALRQGVHDRQAHVLQMFQDDFFTPEQYEKKIADYRADWKKYGVEVGWLDGFVFTSIE